MLDSKCKAHIQQINIYSEISKNISVLYTNNKEILLNLTKNAISNLEYVSLESFIQLSNLIKSEIKNNKNLCINPIYSLAYSYILAMKNQVQNFQLISKILFGFASLYSELITVENSCFVIINKFQIDRVVNSENCIRSNNSTTLVETEFLVHLNTLSNLKDPNFFKNLVFEFFQNLDVTKILNKETNMNFFILLLNNLLSLNSDNFNFFIDLSYEFIDKYKNEIFQYISGVHFNNLVKILSKMNEILLKINENLSVLILTQNLILSNKIKILLYELLFSSKYSNLETTYNFISNHINELLILQKTRNFKNYLYQKNDFLNQSFIDNFFTFIYNKLDPDTKENISLNSSNSCNYAYLIGKIYSFYFNFGSISPIVEERSIFYSNKILQIYKKRKLVINELIIIKVNLFKDFMVNSKHKVNDLEISDQIVSHLEEITVLFRNLKLSPIDIEFYISIIKFLKRCGDNLMIVLINNLSNYLFLWNITEKLEKLFEIFIVDKKDFINKKNEFLEFQKFYSYLKIFNFSSTDKDLKTFYKSIYKFFGENNETNFLNHIQTQNDDDLTRISLLMTYYMKCSEFEKMVHLTFIISKYNYEVYSYSLTVLFSNLKTNKKFQISEKNVFFFLENILELLKHFETQSGNNFKKDNKLFNMTKFFGNLEKNIIFIFKIIINNLTSYLRNSNLDEFSNKCNKFFNYFKILSDVLEQIKIITKVEDLNTSLLVMLIFLDIILNTKEPKSEMTFIKNCLESNLFNDIISNKKYVQLIEIFCLQYLYEKFNPGNCYSQWQWINISSANLDKLNMTQVYKINLNLIFQYKNEEKLEVKYNYINLSQNFFKIYKNFESYDVLNLVNKLKQNIENLDHSQSINDSHNEIEKINKILNIENEKLRKTSLNLIQIITKTPNHHNSEICSRSLNLINELITKDRLIYEHDYILVK